MLIQFAAGLWMFAALAADIQAMSSTTAALFGLAIPFFRENALHRVGRRSTVCDLKR
jgi:hypothetical protein